jgi:dihydropteroate synthase
MAAEAIRIGRWLRSPAVYLFGVVNCSPDSLHRSSIVRTPDEAAARVAWLQANGAQGVDVGGQGSTFASTIVDAEAEWARLADVLPVAVAAADLVSIDTFRPEIMRQAMELGVNVLNAADGMAAPEGWALAAEFEPLVVVPFLNGPDPHHLTHVEGDPLDAMVDYFDERLRLADRYGLRSRCLLDPGTGFGPHGWEWDDRYVYQKHVYSGLDRLRTFDLPLYIPLPWKDTAQHAELLDIVLARRPEYGRAHEPDRIRAAEARIEVSGG